MKDAQEKHHSHNQKNQRKTTQRSEGRTCDSQQKKTGRDSAKHKVEKADGGR